MIFGEFDLKFHAILLFPSLPGHPMDHAHNLSPPPALGSGAEMGGGMGRVHKRKMGGGRENIFWAFEGGERGRQTFAKKKKDEEEENSYLLRQTHATLRLFESMEKY